MSSEKTNSQSGSYYLSPEECQEMFRDFTPGQWASDVPYHQREIVEEQIARYCKDGVEVTPWEDFEKELLEQRRSNIIWMDRGNGT